MHNLCHILYSLVLRLSTLLHAPHIFNFEMWCKAPGTYSHCHQALQLKWITIYICTCCVKTFAKSCIPCTAPVVTLTISPFQRCQAAQWQLHRGWEWFRLPKLPRRYSSAGVDDKNVLFMCSEKRRPQNGLRGRQKRNAFYVQREGTEVHGVSDFPRK